MVLQQEDKKERACERGRSLRGARRREEKQYRDWVGGGGGGEGGGGRRKTVPRLGRFPTTSSPESRLELKSRMTKLFR